jgi:hypothetical protein
MTSDVGWQRRGTVRVGAVWFVLLVSAAVTPSYERAAKGLVEPTCASIFGKGAQGETARSGNRDRFEQCPSDTHALRRRLDVKLLKPLPVQGRESEKCVTNRGHYDALLGEDHLRHPPQRFGLVVHGGQPRHGCSFRSQIQSGQWHSVGGYAKPECDLMGDH